MIYRPIPKIIEDIVAAVRLKYTTENVTPYYDFGVPLEVLNRLNTKTESPVYFDKKYPLIWYLIKGDIKESVSFSTANRRVVKDISIIICNETSADYTSDERYTNNFIPILRPIYDLLMSEIKSSKLVRSLNGSYSHNYYENLFWGNEGLYGHTGNIFNDRLDAIIIDGLDLAINEKC